MLAGCRRAGKDEGDPCRVLKSYQLPKAVFLPVQAASKHVCAEGIVFWGDIKLWRGVIASEPAPVRRRKQPSPLSLFWVADAWDTSRVESRSFFLLHSFLLIALLVPAAACTHALTHLLRRHFCDL